MIRDWDSHRAKAVEWQMSGSHACLGGETGECHLKLIFKSDRDIDKMVTLKGRLGSLFVVAAIVWS